MYHVPKGTKLAVGGWRLAVGFWLLAVSYWLLAVGRSALPLPIAPKYVHLHWDVKESFSSPHLLHKHETTNHWRSRLYRLQPLRALPP